MAIHDSLPGVSIVVCINDEPQPEYDESSMTLEGPAAKNTVIKYIISTVGATFDIQAIIDGTVVKDKSLVFDLWIDSRSVEGAMGVWNHELAEQGMDVLIISKGEHVGLRGQNKVLTAPFKFADLEIGGWPIDDVDAERVRGDKKAAEQIGEIRIEVLHALIWGEHRFQETRGWIRRSAGERGEVVAESKIAEEALKGRDVTHGTKQGLPDEVMEHRVSKSCEYSYVNDEPLAIYVFRYRARDALIKSRIIREPEVEGGCQVPGGIKTEDGIKVEQTDE